MEDQNKSKVVSMDSKENPSQTEELSYDDLKKACVDLSQQNQYLKARIQQAEKYIQTINRLDYLFRAVECAGSNKNNAISFSSEFIEMCVKEIENLMTIPEEEEDSKAS